MDIQTYCTLNAKKTDKAVPAEAGTLAALTADGNLADTGVMPDMLAPRHGFCPGLRSGRADDLVGGDLRRGERFLFRPTAARCDSGVWLGTGAQDGIAEIRALYGAGVLLRQLCSTNPSNYTIRNVTLTADGEVFTMTSATETSAQKKAELGVKRGHLLWGTCSYRGDGTVSGVLFGLQRDSGTMVAGGTYEADGSWRTAVFSGRAEADTDNVFSIRLPNASAGGAWAQFREVMLFDLTAAFGEGSEPGAEDFRRWFAQSYVPYTRYPALIPFRGTALRTVGANALDPSSGEARVVCGAAYVPGGTFTEAAITPDAGGDAVPAVPDAETGTWTAPADGTLTLTGAGADAFVCLRGEEDAFRSDTLSLPNEIYFPDGMRAVRGPGGEVRDELTSFAAVRRVASVRMSALRWTTQESRFVAELPADAAGDPAVLTNRYPRAGTETAAMPNRTFTVTPGANGAVLIVIRDTSYTTSGAFRASLTAADEIWYETAEPVMTLFPHPFDLTVRTFAGGTEEVLTDVVPTAPVTADVSYGYDLRAAARAFAASQPLCRWTDEIPSSPDSPAAPGTLAADAEYLYVRTPSGWKRTALA